MYILRSTHTYMKLLKHILRITYYISKQFKILRIIIINRYSYIYTQYYTIDELFIITIILSYCTIIIRLQLVK